MFVFAKKQNWSSGSFDGNVECTEFVKQNLCESRDSSKFKKGVLKPRFFCFVFVFFVFLPNLRNIQQKEAFIPHLLPHVL